MAVRRLSPPRRQLALTALALMAATAALHWAQAVAVPIALAVLFAFVLAPAVEMLERRHVPSAFASVLVVALTVLALGGFGWALGTQLSSLGREIPRYRGNIQARIEQLRGAHKGTVIDNVQKMAEDVAGSMKAEPADPKRRSNPVPVVIEPPSVLWQLPSVFQFVATAGFVMVLVVFMLLRRRDARNRIIRLVGDQRLAMTTKALDETSQRITRYLVRQSLVNLCFGVAVAAGLLVIGVPYALVWGTLATTLRFIPYVGSWIAAAAPTLLSLAVFPGWMQPLLVLGLIVLLELTMYAGIEPWLYGRGAGLSDLALLIGIAFWTWLWGPVGLVLATPMTVCLVVLSKHVPAFEAVTVLLDDELGVEPSALYYQRLLARDDQEALALAAEYLQTHTREELIEDVLFPAVVSAKRDRERDLLTEEEAHFVHETTRWVVDRLAELTAEGTSSPRVEPTMPEQEAEEAPHRVVACPVRDEADETALRLLALVVDTGPAGLLVASHRLLVAETIELIDRERPEVVCIGSLPPGGLASTRYLVKRLRARFPELRIVVWRLSSGRSFELWSDQLVGLGAERVVGTLRETRGDIMALLGSPRRPAAQAIGA